jgi:hypothetical protein
MAFATEPYRGRQFDRILNKQYLDPPRECEPTYRLDEYIAEARAEMGEVRWAELQAEWNSSAGEGRL